MCQVVDGKVKLEAVLADTGGDEHDTCVAPELKLVTVIPRIMVSYWRLT